MTYAVEMRQGILEIKFGSILLEKRVRESILGLTGGQATAPRGRAPWLTRESGCSNSDRLELTSQYSVTASLPFLNLFYCLHVYEQS